ncbi:MAG: sigma 54-interacting transcriptional regulator [Pseudomonadota bacterium]
MGFCLVGQIDGDPVRLQVPEGESILGAEGHNELVLAYPTVSRRHLRIDLADGELTIEDLASSNGTFVDGRRIRGAESVTAGQEVRLGEVRLQLEPIAPGDDLIGAAIESGEEKQSHSLVEGTLAPVASDRLAFDHLPELLDKLSRSPQPAEAARLIGETFFAGLPLIWLRLSDIDGAEAVLFEAGQPVPGEQQRFEFRPLCMELQLAPHCVPGREERLLLLARSLMALIDDGQLSEQKPTPSVSGWPDPPPLDPDVREVYQRAGRIAHTDISVLIQGESGTGKDLLAQFIHNPDGDHSRPFVALNCAALPPDLLEAELFGIEKGVATGVEARAGCFERAHGGTLFLDEIGDMSLETQAKILRVLQDGEIERVGGTRTVPARPRIVSATNRDVEAMVADGSFRLDLLHRIAGWEVTLPPLRERPADIPNLAVHFLVGACDARQTRIRGISQRALDCLRRYHWPGNVRELQREMHRVAVFLGQNDLLTGKDIRAVIRDANQAGDNDSLEGQLAIAERSIIKHALARSKGNVSEAARQLDVSRSTLYRRLEQLDLESAADKEP